MIASSSQVCPFTCFSVRFARSLCHIETNSFTLAAKHFGGQFSLTNIIIHYPCLKWIEKTVIVARPISPAAWGGEQEITRRRDWMITACKWKALCNWPSTLQYKNILVVQSFCLANNFKVPLYASARIDLRGRRSRTTKFCLSIWQRQGHIGHLM